MTEDAGPAETLEDQLARVERMAAIARLAGGHGGLASSPDGGTFVRAYLPIAAS